MAALVLTLATTAALGAEATADLKAAPPASWSLGIRSTGYMYQSVDGAGTSTDRFRTFQVLSGTASNLAGGKLTFRGAGRFANDPALIHPGFENAKLYTGLLEARLAPGLRARLGRQFIQAGVAAYTVDGGWLGVRPRGRWGATLWGGALAPTARSFEPGKPDESAAAGGRLSFRPHRRLRLAFSAAYRERYGRVAERPVGFELNTGAVRNLRILGRAAYDLESERWARFQAQARWRPGPDLPLVDFQFVDRLPSVDASSWFSRFIDVERIRVVRTALRHETPSGFGGELSYLGSFVDTRSSSRLGLALLVPGGRAGYAVRLGDAGEENRFFGEYGRQVRPWLWLEGSATFLTYALLEDAPTADERELTTFAARARADLRPGLRVLAEVQSLDNPLFDKDVRLLVGVDLSMGRGASRFGLDRGGWRR